MFPRFLPPLLCAGLLLSLASATAASPTATQPGIAATLCPISEDQGNCVRILACIGDQGRWFHGRAFGRGEGTLSGLVSDGVQCSGTWTSRNAFGTGQANVVCDDGMEVTVIYFYQDEHSGTARGKGISNRKEPVDAWSGENVLDYFRDGQPTAEAVLKCGVFDIPLS